MNEVVFRYFLMFSFVAGVFKSAMKGFTSEVISLTFAVLGFCSGCVFFRPNTKYIALSASIFFIIYIYGLYVAYKKRSFNILQIIFGALVGVFKYFLFLSTLVSIASLMQITSEPFLNSEIIKFVLPYSKEIEKFLLKYFLQI